MKLLFFLLFIFPEFSLAKLSVCEISETQLESYLSMNFYDFDQGSTGWRALAVKSCYKEAAELQVKFRENNFTNMLDWEKRTSSWHIGQMYAFANLSSNAIKYFELSIKDQDQDKSGFKWNDYVNASIAFLNKDRDSLLNFRERLYSGDSPYNRMNLRIVDSFLRCPDSFYKEAYSKTCTPRETEIDRLNATAIEIQNIHKISSPINAYFKNHDIIAIGEVHGNNESIDLFHSIVKSLSLGASKLLVGLEIPRTEQHRVDQFLKTLDVSVLKESEFFNSQFQDGRASKAMLGLLQGLAKLQNVKVLCFDHAEGLSAQMRDNKMSELIFEKLSNEDFDRAVILTGDIHASLKVGTDSNSSFVPMLKSLDNRLSQASESKKILNIQLRYKELNTWACFSPGCKKYEISHSHSPYSVAVPFSFYFTLEDELEEQGYKSSIFIRKSTASLPMF